MLTRQQARNLLEQFAENKLARIAMGADMGGPLVMLGDDESPFRHVGTLKDADDGRSAYHIAHAMHEVVQHLNATNITVCMFAYKVIQGIKYHGFMLYHVDSAGNVHTRILDPERWNHWILDGSEYWKSFPYSFATGPHPMPAILGRHEDEAPSKTSDYDDLLRP